MSTWLRTVLVTIVVAISMPTSAAIVYVLGDDQSEDVINPYLEAQGHTVLFDSIYYDWNGDIPSDVEVVLYLAGYDYGYETGEDGDPERANQMLLDFVAAGGGLIFTEWYAYNELDEPLADLLPVEYNGAYDVQTEWNVASGFGSHPLITNLLATTFTEGEDDDSYSDVVALDGTTVVMENPDGIPLLSYTEKHGGTVVHINDGLTYDDYISEEMLSVIDSSVRFAAGTPVYVSAPSTVGLLMMSLLFFGSIRRK